MDQNDHQSAGGVFASLRRYAVIAAALCCFAQQSEAVAVDAELLFLVDVTRSVSDSEFSTMMESYAQAFESAEVLSSLQSGENGSIAASLVFYGSRRQQSVGVGWIEISSAADAEAFAAAIRGAVRPGSSNKSSIASAIDTVAPYFGDEVGGPANGFESEVQSLTIMAVGIDDGSRPTGGSRAETVEAARDAALASGLDVINAVTIGAAGSVDDYFASTVIGGGTSAGPAALSSVADVSELGGTLTPFLSDTIAAAVPEPGWWWSVGMAFVVLARRRRT